MSDYDVIEYPAKPFLQCHPERLAIMARLFGLAAAPPRSARVLELGCGDGLNLIAAAITMPHAVFSGVDLSRTAIRRGSKIIREIGLKNVRLKQLDFRELSPTAKRFHYVIAHGLYSWLPPDARDDLLATIKAVLAPDGVAFVSYNAYPGACLRQMVREMARIFGGSDLARVRDWLQTARTLPTGPPLYRAIVADEAADMLGREDGALFHDDLAATNQPFWFRDFMAQANSHGLQYLSEADLATTGSFGQTGNDRIMLEQHSDFLTGRRFRQTLLCHSGQAVLHQPDAHALQGCFAGGPFNTSSVEQSPILQSLAAAWPTYLPVDDFGAEARQEILSLFGANLLDLRTSAPPVAGPSYLSQRGSRPEASPLARIQARHSASVTNLHHIEVRTQSDSLRAVLTLADGTRTRAGLIRDVQRLYPSESRNKVALAVDQHLEELRQYGLIQA